VHALMAARAHEELRVIVVFHGFAFRPANAQPGAQPYDLAGDVNVPTLVLHGTDDERAPIADMRRMEARMRELGKVASSSFMRAPDMASRCVLIPATKPCRDAELRRGEALSGNAPQLIRLVKTAGTTP